MARGELSATACIVGIGREMSSRRCFARPPKPSNKIVARTEGYTYAARVLDLSLVQGAVFCRPVPNPNRPIRNFSIAVCNLCVCRSLETLS